MANTYKFNPLISSGFDIVDTSNTPPSGGNPGQLVAYVSDRTGSTSFQRIGNIAIRNDRIELTHVIATIYAGGPGVSNMFLLLQGRSPGTDYLRTAVPVSTDNENQVTFALTSIPGISQTDINLRIAIASGGGGQVHLDGLTFLYNLR